jgi:hypothetical protein
MLLPVSKCAFGGSGQRPRIEVAVNHPTTRAYIWSGLGSVLEFSLRIFFFYKKYATKGLVLLGLLCKQTFGKRTGTKFSCCDK